MYFLQFIVNFPCYSMGISFFCQFSMLSNCYFAFFSFFVNFPCYSMENVHFSIVCKFSMLFNGKFASCHFPMLFNGKFAFCHFPMLFNGNLRIEKVGGDVRTDGRTNGRTENVPILQDFVPYRGRCPITETTSTAGRIISIDEGTCGLRPFSLPLFRETSS